MKLDKEREKTMCARRWKELKIIYLGSISIGEKIAVNLLELVNRKTTGRTIL